MVGGDNVVQHAQAEALLCLEQPVEPPPAVTGELEKKFFLVAAMGNVPDVIWQKAAVGTRHRTLSLECYFRP